MKKTTSSCVLCGASFEHYITQPAKYCPQCLAQDRTKTCSTCGKIFRRIRKENLDSFLAQANCPTCRKLPSPQKHDDMSQLFTEIVQDPRNCAKYCPTGQALEDAVNEACASFRLYFLHVFLLPYKNGPELCDRPPEEQAHLLDILRRIKNINDLLRRTQTKRLRIDKPSSLSDLEGPTDEELTLIENQYATK